MRRARKGAQYKRTRDPHAPMPLCPRCGDQLHLDRGVFRDPHGIFVPGSEMRRRLSANANAAMRASLGRALSTSLACPSCMDPLVSSEVGIEATDPLAFMACAGCEGWWFDAPELAKLRDAVLHKPIAMPERVGGYGGHAIRTSAHAWLIPEAIHSMLREHLS